MHASSPSSSPQVPGNLSLFWMFLSWVFQSLWPLTCLPSTVSPEIFPAERAGASFISSLDGIPLCGVAMFVWLLTS